MLHIKIARLLNQRMHDHKCSIIFLIKTFIPPTLIPNFSLSHINRDMQLYMNSLEI